MNPEVIKAGNFVNREKLKDIQKLQEKHNGEVWETYSSLQFCSAVI
jgi:hypothetical protein